MYQKGKKSDLKVQSTVHGVCTGCCTTAGSKVSTECALRVSYSSHIKWSFIETDCILIGFSVNSVNVFCVV
jgi:hypothetical protein